MCCVGSAEGRTCVEVGSERRSDLERERSPATFSRDRDPSPGLGSITSPWRAPFSRSALARAKPSRSSVIVRGSRHPLRAHGPPPAARTAASYEARTWEQITREVCMLLSTDRSPHWQARSTLGSSPVAGTRRSSSTRCPPATVGPDRAQSSGSTHSQSHRIA